MTDILTLIREILTVLSPLALPFIAWYIRKLEKNTNSIKDALIIANYNAGYAAGIKSMADSKKNG